MPRFQMKHGIALLIIGILSFALEHGHPFANLTSAYIGALVVLIGYLADSFPSKLPGWRSMFPQINAMLLLSLIFLAGFMFYHDGIIIWPAPVSVIGDLATLVVCFKCLFVTNVAFQEEFENEEQPPHLNAG